MDLPVITLMEHVSRMTPVNVLKRVSGGAQPSVLEEVYFRQYVSEPISVVASFWCYCRGRCGW